MILIKSFLTEAFYDRLYLSKGDKVCNCYSCLEMIIQVLLYVGFFTIFFNKHASLKQFYIKLLQLCTTFKQKK